LPMGVTAPMPVTTARRERSGEGIAPDCSRAQMPAPDPSSPRARPLAEPVSLTG
jgi:hypothetical protein